MTSSSLSCAGHLGCLFCLLLSLLSPSSQPPADRVSPNRSSRAHNEAHFFEPAEWSVRQKPGLPRRCCRPRSRFLPFLPYPPPPPPVFFFSHLCMCAAEFRCGHPRNELWCRLTHSPIDYRKRNDHKRQQENKKVLQIS